MAAPLPVIGLTDIAWLVAVVGHGGEVGPVLESCRAAATDARLLQPLAMDVHTRSRWGIPARRTRLQHAARVGNVARIAQLLAAGADANVKDAYGATPVAYALIAGRADAARALLSAGASPDAALAVTGDSGLGPNWRTALVRAPVQDLVAELCARPDVTALAALTAAITFRLPAAVTSALARAVAERVAATGEAPDACVLAVLRDGRYGPRWRDANFFRSVPPVAEDVDTARALLSHPASVIDALSCAGTLSCAAWVRELLPLPLAAGALATLPALGVVALWAAAAAGCADLVTALLAAGVPSHFDPHDPPFAFAEQPVAVALARGFDDVFRLLVAAPDAQPLVTLEALLRQHNRPRARIVVDEIISSGDAAAIAAALELAVGSSETPMIMQLLDAGADAAGVDLLSYVDSRINWAVCGDDDDDDAANRRCRVDAAITRLIAAGAYVGAFTLRCAAAAAPSLHAAACVRALARAAPNQGVNAAALTAALAAAAGAPAHAGGTGAGGDADIVRELLAAGAAVDGVTAAGETALAIAERNGHAAVAAALRAAGADVDAGGA